MKIITKLFFLLCFLFVVGYACKQKEQEIIKETKILEIKGVDVSYLPEIRKSGVLLKNAQNNTEDMLQTLKNAGVNVIRLRVWKNPFDATSNVSTIKNLSQEVKNMGMKVLLTVHYSDTWADPNHQTKPTEWQNITFDQLKDSVFTHTQKIMSEIKPDYIQIGNEINSGFLWSEGHSFHTNQMKELLKKGIQAVRQNNQNTKIIIHLAGHEDVNAFYADISNLDYDIIGLSYYPLWHGKDLEILKKNLITISNNHNKPIFMAETSYPFTIEWNDWTNNVVGLQMLPDYPATPQGQKNYLDKIKNIMLEVPKGIGFCYWGAEWISYKGNNATNASTWENQAFWDFENKALPILEVYK